MPWGWPRNDWRAYLKRRLGYYTVRIGLLAACYLGGLAAFVALGTPDGGARVSYGWASSTAGAVFPVSGRFPSN
jgi:hypothetical protein